MSWTFDNNKPIYLQIMDKIKLQIVSHTNNFQLSENWLVRLASILIPSNVPYQT